ncbi:hypothetical protein MNQ98_16645 [Paenibacillus sp. N3/727]|uniref:hypothetical protein n=1 Tax=Paenibacillus sp. N3/727 TaxID=2925845 RepID=UPI001F52E4B6|nr:hypothetical protein [Paenibacillus sp. N3/727]UNK16160.1 hypothetical protein MNQ98_16645 [Paenibacillus sp. N3/727]
MNIKSVAISALVGVSMLFGSVGVSASPANTDSVSPYANLSLILRPGESHHFQGTVFVVNNAMGAITVQLPSSVKGLKPGQAVIDVYANGQYTRYDVFVKAF